MSQEERQIERLKKVTKEDATDPIRKSDGSQESQVLGLEEIKDIVVHWISILSLGALFLGTLTSYVIVLWHSLAPESMHWLHNDFFLHILRPVILSAAAGSIASLVMWYFFQKQKDKPTN